MTALRFAQHAALGAVAVAIVVGYVAIFAAETMAAKMRGAR